MNLNDNIERFKNKIKNHEDNIKFLNSQSNRFAESILDLQVSLGRYHSANVTTENGNGSFHTEEETIEHTLKKENSAAGIFCRLKTNSLTQKSNLEFAKDAVGVVATLARVESDDLSSILSEYLGLESMLAIVCNTYEGVNALEKYEAEGMIKCNGGLHGLGSSIGRRINGRFVVICLEDLRPFVGGLVANDPQKKLALPKPRLPSGECPPGLLDYAIYKTRNEMLLALPCISHGALSLDGGMIKKRGMFALGGRKDVEVKFPLISGESDVPPNYIQAEDMVRKLKWESSKLTADIQRELQLLDYEKGNFTSQA